MIDKSQLENLKERLDSIERLLENIIYRDAERNELQILLDKTP